MSDYVTHTELEQAIRNVVDRIDETEQILRTEFHDAFKFEIKRFDRHLGEQDETLKWINRWTLAVLVSVIIALIYLIH